MRVAHPLLKVVLGILQRGIRLSASRNISADQKQRHADKAERQQAPQHNHTSGDQACSLGSLLAFLQKLVLTPLHLQNFLPDRLIRVPPVALQNFLFRRCQSPGLLQIKNQLQLPQPGRRQLFEMPLALLLRWVVRNQRSLRGQFRSETSHRR